MIVGQKVVCVDDKFSASIAQFYVAFPVQGQVYVIRSVCVGIGPGGTEGEVCVHLVGLLNPRSSVAPYPERGFNAERFRPLDEIQEQNRREEQETKYAEV